jgi:aspartate-semialdehyde dehydrogenase
MTCLAIVGAGGLVGQTLVALLEERSLKITRLIPIGSAPGRTVRFRGEDLDVLDLNAVDFKSIDVVILAAGRDVSLRHAQEIARAGCIVIDNSSAFRQHDHVPLIVPELNSNSIHTADRIIANPNCIAIQLALVLSPLQQFFGIARADITTSQAASGAGHSLVKMLDAGDEIIAGTIVPCIGELDEHGRCEEERKIETELHRLLDAPDMRIATTATRVPVHNGHGASVHLCLQQPVRSERLAALLQESPGVRFVDARERPAGPTARDDASGQNDVLVGRLRINPDHPREVQMWIVADNLRRGAALNAILILEHVLRVHGLIARA